MSHANTRYRSEENSPLVTVQLLAVLDFTLHLFIVLLLFVFLVLSSSSLYFSSLSLFSMSSHFRTAIEAHLLGARTVLTERRPKFTRNNVLKLWKFVVADLKSLGAKYFYGKLCVGSINHVNIRTLQLILTKICCVIGVNIYTPCAFLGTQLSSLSAQVSTSPPSS